MKRIHSLKIFEDKRKDLRNNSTYAEKQLWRFLKNKKLDGIKFTRQHSIGKYIADFYCPAEKLIIELDGQQHFEIRQMKYDEERTRYLNAFGFKVIRFRNTEVIYRIDEEAFKAPPP